MTLRAEVLVAACLAAGLVIGLTVGLLVGGARTFGGAGAMAGFVIGCLLTVLPPWTKRTPPGPGRRRKR